jgi:hypothetical protein
MTADELAVAVGTAAAQEMTSALNRIKHCLGQLSDEQIWWRSHPAMNSVGNLILHLCGNVRQWQLVEPRRIQGADITGLQAIFNSVPHFRGHTQEIIHITRLQLGDTYRLAWEPKSPEEGAPP